MPQTRQRQTTQDLWDKIWRDRSGKVVVWQTPSPLLIVWVVVTMISLLIPSRLGENVTFDISLVLLAIWALLEVFRGVNYFRRALGVFILLLTVGAAFGIGL